MLLRSSECAEQHRQKGAADMCPAYDLEYGALQNDYQAVLKYLFRAADSFSVITTTARPFSEKPALAHDGMLAPLESHLIKQVVGCRKWPGTETRDIHKVFCLYIANPGSRDIVSKWGNMFKAPELSLPQDICFYRRGEPFFVTVSHERTACILNFSRGDDDFFREYRRTV